MTAGIPSPGGLQPSTGETGGRLEAAVWQRSRQRLRLYGGRLRRTVVGPGLAHPCLFMHLPKCGGTSLAEALYAAVPIHRRIGVIDAPSTRRAAAIVNFGRDDPLLCHEDLANGAMTFALREQIMLAHMCWGTTLIHGHVLYTDAFRRHFADRYRVVTIMRDPIERSISNFRMNARVRGMPADVDAWLASPVGVMHATVNLRYLSGRHDAGEDPAANLALARDTVDRLALVGFLDNIPKLQRDFADLFGPGLVLRHHNEAKGREVALSAEQRRRLERLCAPDIELYERARARFG